MAATSTQNQTSFEALTDPYRYELLIHCYRILGSLEDAEDALQETMLRGWRHFESLKKQMALRAWLYRIATNVCLDAVDKRKSRSLPTLTHPPAVPLDSLPPLNGEYSWIDPLPEFYVNSYIKSPEQSYESLEQVTLAFLAMLQHLPGRQRAVLILCDVLDWKTREVADALDMTVVAVNSALQRARMTLKKHQENDVASDVASPELSALLARYVEAWQTADLSSLISLLHDDAKLTMPPFPIWFRGRGDIGGFFQRFVFAGRNVGDFRMEATHSNGRPAFLLYQRDENGNYPLAALHLLTIQGGKITQIDDFLAFDAALFSRFEK